MELIKNWLAGKRNFIVGAVLYKRFGNDEKLKKLFDTRNPDAHIVARLVKELEALLQKPKVVLQDPPKHGDADEMPAAKDPVLEAIRNEWMPLYQRMNYLRHELDRYEENTPEQIGQRKVLAKEILQLEQQCMRMWDKRDHYMKHGQLPELKKKEDPIPTDPVELGLSVENCRRNIRRNRQLANANPDNAAYIMKVRYYEEKLQRLINPNKDESPGKQA